MGVIKRQSIKQSVISYIALAVGAIATLKIYPLHLEAKGEADGVLTFATLFMPFAVLGGGAIIIRFFPLFQNKKSSHNGYLFFLLIYYFIALSLFTIAYFVFFENIIEALIKCDFPNTGFLNKYKIHILALVWILAINAFLTSYTANFKRTAIPTLFYNLLPKVGLPILVLSVVFEYISIEMMINGLLLLYILIAVCLLTYLYLLGELKIRIDTHIFKSGRLKEIVIYALYGMLGGIGSVFAFRIDQAMIMMFSSSTDTGIYTINSFIGSSIQAPTMAISAIASPIIASSIASSDMKNVASVYKKSSINLLIVGLLLFSCIWMSADSLLRITPNYNSLLPAIYVVFWLGLSKVIDMATSVNGQIIGFSKYFRFNLLMVSILAVINITLNYQLIPKYGVTGAAVATFISIFVFNLAKLIFIKWKFDMQPFSKNTFYLLIIGGLTFAIGYIIPVIDIPIIDIFIKCSAICAIYIPAVLYFRISEDMNLMAIQMYQKIKNSIKR